MSASPLFVVNNAALVATLRLSGVATGADAEAIIDQAIAEVRLGFLKRLGLTRVNQIKAYSAAVADTAGNMLIVEARITETKWLRWLLLRRLPSMFVDASAERQAFNQEGFTREQDPGEIAHEINRLRVEVETSLTYLSGTAVEEDTLNVSVIGPDTTPPAPGSSVWGS